MQPTWSRRHPLGGVSRLDLLIGSVVGAAALVIAWLAFTFQQAPERNGWSLAGVIAAALLVVVDRRPISVPRGEDVEEFSLSIIFSLALVLIGPLLYALAIQLLALILDDVRQRRAIRKCLFNAAQFTMTLTAARLTYSLASGRPLATSSADFSPHDIGPSLLAAATFFVLNTGLTALVLGVATGQPVMQGLRDDFRMHLGVSGVMLCLSPVVVLSLQFSPMTLPLLLLPVAAVYVSATLALRDRHRALHDELTGLPNRALFLQKSTVALADGATTASVLLIDLDHFREINDTLGHPFGDQVLRSLTARLSDVLGDDGFVARLGGDEFAILVCGGTEETARAWANTILALLRTPLDLDGVRLVIPASIGMALAPQHGSDPDLLLQRADVALYRAKSERDRCEVYNVGSDENSLQRLALLAQLRDALARDELILHYQPKADPHTGAIVGVEALVRWAHPERGLLGPDLFIPLAERTGLIRPLTLYALEQSIRDARLFSDLGYPLRTSVNLSARDLVDNSLVLQVATLLERSALPAHMLVLEVTESAVMADPHRAATVLAGLRALGVQIAIDDFGTGQSSLAYLKRLSVDELKIDKSFVLGMSADHDDAVIVRSTIELGHSLGLTVVAEGVEDADTWRMLRAMGCDVIQGYYLSRPMPSVELVAWLASSQRTTGDSDSACCSTVPIQCVLPGAAMA